MDISYIDNLAINTKSPVHKASAISKIVLVVLVITAIIVTANPQALAICFMLLVVTILLARLPVGRILAMTGYAFFFSLIFAFSEVEGGIDARVTIILKSVTAALSLILLITTTPYPQVFALFQKVLPSVMVDVMLVTYRSFFILIGQISSMITAIRIRGGYSSRAVFKNLSSIGRIVGNGIIHAWELSESMQDAMYVRGYSGRLPAGSSWNKIGKYDILPLAIGVAVLAVAVLV
ncbi:MAG TPA: energy-coupling factor transporter transmembrane component T [Candidatus Aquicultor sp.]|jgi:cobalt/nickel transport system permease protein